MSPLKQNGSGKRICVLNQRYSVCVCDGGPKRGKGEEEGGKGGKRKQRTERMREGRRET